MSPEKLQHVPKAADLFGDMQLELTRQGLSLGNIPLVDQVLARYGANSVRLAITNDIISRNLRSDLHSFDKLADSGTLNEIKETVLGSSSDNLSSENQANQLSLEPKRNLGSIVTWVTSRFPNGREDLYFDDTSKLLSDRKHEKSLKVRAAALVAGTIVMIGGA
jgi:hypothetical protein